MIPKFKPYTQEGSSWMVATGYAKFLRTCKLWQIFKFFYYNTKIILVVWKMGKEHN